MQPSNIIKQREAECRDGISLRPVPRCLLTTEECSHLIASLHSSSPIHAAADKTQPPPHTTFPHNLPAKPRACAPPTARPAVRMRPATALRALWFPFSTHGSRAARQHMRSDRRSFSPSPEASWSFRKAAAGCFRRATPPTPPGFRLPHPVSPRCRCSPLLRGTPPCPCCATTGAAASASTPRPTRRVRTGRGVRHGAGTWGSRDAGRWGGAAAGWLDSEGRLSCGWACRAEPAARLPAWGLPASACPSGLGGKGP